MRALRALEYIPPKKNLILSAERLRRVRHFLRRMRRAAARHLGGADSSSYFKRRPQVAKQVVETRRPEVRRRRGGVAQISSKKLCVTESPHAQPIE